MKRILITMFALVALLFAGNVNAQFTIANDNASNYSSDNFTASGSLGYGFGTWAAASTDGGRFLGTATNNGASNAGILNSSSQSFGMWATNFSDVGRNFTSLSVGAKLKLSLSFQWDNGNKGFSLYTGGVNVDQIFNFNIAAAGYTWSGEGTQTMTAWNVAPGDRQNGVVLSFEFTQTGTGLDYQIIALAGDGGFGTKTGSLSFTGSINALKFYVSNAGGDGGNLYFNNISIENSNVNTSIDNTVGFRLMASPASTTFGTLLGPVWTQGITGSDSPSFGTANVWTWNNASTTSDNTNWTAIGDMGNTISSGSGFLYYHFNDDNFDATPNGSATVLSVTGAENAAPTITVNANTDMYTLVGNPFATAISWNSLTKTNLYTSAQVHHPTSGWQEVTSESPLIAPFQAVFVRTSAASPALGITSAAKASGGTFVGKVVAPTIVSIEAKGAEMTDLNRIVFSSEASLGHDWMDTERLAPLNPHYMILPMVGEGGRLYSSVSLPELVESVEIPVSVDFTKSGVIELKIRDFNPPAGYTLEFVDTFTGNSFNIDADFTYEFTHTSVAKVRPFDEIIAQFGVLSSASEPRFKIVITPPGTTSVEVGADLPVAAELSQNYPNPFNPTTRITYAVPVSGEVRLAVYDLLGREVAVLVNGSVAAGSHTVNFDASALGSGVYIYRLNSGGQTITRKMTLVK